LKHAHEDIRLSRLRVAPCAGAWIETCITPAALYACASPPARGRGLKHMDYAVRMDTEESPPARGRGLKRYLRGCY